MGTCEDCDVEVENCNGCGKPIITEPFRCSRPDGVDDILHFHNEKCFMDYIKKHLDEFAPEMHFCEASE